MGCFLKPDNLSLPPVMPLVLVRSNFSLLLLPTTRCCLLLSRLLLPVPPQLLVFYSLITILGDGISYPRAFCVSHISVTCVCWLLFFAALGGCLLRFPLNPALLLGFIRGARSWEEPVSQNKSITIQGINGSTASDASVIERITVRIDITGLTGEMDYIPSIHWLHLKI